MSNAYRSSLASSGPAPIGDATAADVLTGKTFSGAVGSGVTGTMPNRGAVSGTATPTTPYTIPSGYHNGSGTVRVSGAFTPTLFEILTSNTAYTFTNDYPVVYISSDDDHAPTMNFASGTVTVMATAQFERKIYKVTNVKSGDSFATYGYDSHMFATIIG